MSSFIPNGGIKKPLNFIEGPIYPDIKKDILRFKTSRKYWTVSVGDALKETEKYPMFVDGAIELQTRNRNETIYGKSSHKSYVNEEVRLPLISPYDLFPLSKQPRRPVIPRVNPGIDLNSGIQIIQNNMINELYGYTTDRVTYVPSNATYTRII